MKIELIENRDNDLKNSLEIFILKDLKRVNKGLKKVLKRVGFEANEGDSSFYKDSLYVGANSLKGEDLKIAAANAIKEVKKTKYEKAIFSLVNNSFEFSLSKLTEGIILGAYDFNKYKKKNLKKELEIFIDIKESKKSLKFLEKEFIKTLNISKSVNKVRDIVNSTPEDFNPKTMVNEAKKVALENCLECKIYGEEYLKINGMNAMLAVGRASRHESYLIHLSYKPKEPKGKVVFVGKGLTYDSGGLSLKSADGMISMKCDKSGGSAILGIMNSLSAINCQYEVHGIIGAVENMIGADAYKPDDILKAKNATTIEVRNTDAEGRLVLADCLCYAQDEIEDIDYIFDIATLTGACIIALGEYTIGVMGHSSKMKKRVQKASKQSGELVGFLPYNRYLPKMIKSQIADIVNSTTSKAGSAITASLFLDNFIKKENKKKWLHLDIAGAAYREKVWGYNPYGGTGASVRLLLKFLENLNK